MQQKRSRLLYLPPRGVFFLGIDVVCVVSWRGALRRTDDVLMTRISTSALEQTINLSMILAWTVVICPQRMSHTIMKNAPWPFLRARVNSFDTGYLVCLDCTVPVPDIAHGFELAAHSTLPDITHGFRTNQFNSIYPTPRAALGSSNNSTLPQISRGLSTCYPPQLCLHRTLSFSN